MPMSQYDRDLLTSWILREDGEQDPPWRTEADHHCGWCCDRLTTAHLEDEERPMGYCSVDCAEAESAELEREANAVDL